MPSRPDRVFPAWLPAGMSLPARCRFQFSLRTLLVLVTLAAVVMSAWTVRRYVAWSVEGLFVLGFFILFLAIACGGSLLGARAGAKLESAGINAGCGSCLGAAVGFIAAALLAVLFLKAD